LNVEKQLTTCCANLVLLHARVSGLLQIVRHSPVRTAVWQILTVRGWWNTALSGMAGSGDPRCVLLHSLYQWRTTEL